MSEGEAHLRQAVQLAPGWPQPLSDLAWLLATSPELGRRDPAEALRFAERPVTLTGGTHPALLDTRAAAEAALGRFDAAIASELRAIELASRSPGDPGHA